MTGHLVTNTGHLVTNTVYDRGFQAALYEKQNCLEHSPLTPRGLAAGPLNWPAGRGACPHLPCSLLPHGSYSRGQIVSSSAQDPEAPSLSPGNDSPPPASALCDLPAPAPLRPLSSCRGHNCRLRSRRGGHCTGSQPSSAWNTLPLAAQQTSFLTSLRSLLKSNFLNEALKKRGSLLQLACPPWAPCKV